LRILLSNSVRRGEKEAKTTGVQLTGVASERNEHGSRQTDPSIVTEDEGWQWEQSSFLFDMGEDNGLLGVGA